ncbi:hypothetical protein H6P81_011697 [Aristolochia fimbriata]|uniref:EamA domain-containing protein n=1 Tax=Aristolochia fimbriata TaxID=158543 RepID=A0AAV7EBC1_ARIFI|nr:hypothetical protein H6P81_011697 [Aristolochia fimbriata]
MASPSACRCSCESHFTLSSVNRVRNRRSHFVRVALDDTPQPGSAPSSYSTFNKAQTKINHSRQNLNSETLKKTRNFSEFDSSIKPISADESRPVDGGGIRPPTVQSRQRHKIFRVSLRKGPLWKRIFFASKKVRSIILLNVLTVIYASNIPVVKEVQEIMDPSLFTVVRFAVTAIPFLPFVLKSRRDSQTRAAGLELGVWVSLGYLTQALGLLTSDAGRASFIAAFTVVAVPIIDGMLGATIPAITWFGAIVSLVGVALLESSGSPPSVGDILNLLSAVFFGVHMLRTEHISRVTKKENYLALLGYEVCVVAVFSTIWYLFMGGFGGVQKWNTSWSWPTILTWLVSFPWIPALYTGVFSTGLCLWLEIAAMCDVSATETAIIYGLEPLWGAAFAWFLLGERWGTSGWIGAALVLGGSITVQMLGSAPERSKEPGKSDQSSRPESSDRPNDFSTSVITVSSRDDVRKLFKK